MQSPLGLACRALIMLGCLIAMPLIAVFGLPDPELVQEFLPIELVWGGTREAAEEFSATLAGETLRYHSGDLPPVPQANRLESRFSDPNRNVREPLTAAPPIMQASFMAELEGTDSDPTPAALVPVRRDPSTSQFTQFSARTGEIDVLWTRLEELGAVQPELEPWGTGGDLYRFQVRVAVRPELDLYRYVEAIETNPTRAVRAVLAEVESRR